MTPENFTYWLQGYFELSDSNNLSKEQVEVIKEHLALVLSKQTTKFVKKDLFDIVDVETCLSC